MWLSRAILILLTIFSDSVRCDEWHDQIRGLPDPVAPYREMILSGAHVDFEDGVTIQFKNEQPMEGFHGDVTEYIAANQDDKARLLNGVLALMMHNSQFNVAVLGFADAAECQVLNCHDLSLRRARGFYDLLIEKGVPASRIEGPQGLGGEERIDDNSTEDGRALNRRVEVNLVLRDGG